MDNFTLYLCGVLIAIIAYCVFKIRKNYNYFADNGVLHLKSPHWIFGSLKELMWGGKVSWYEGYQNLCKAEEIKNAPYFGFYLMHHPAIMIQEPELIKQILLKDFSSFSDRSLTAEKHDPLGHYNMFTVRGELWRNIRQKFSPFFTSGRLKMMFYLLEMTADEMITVIDKDKQNDMPKKVDLKNLFYLCTTDIIARCAFGVDANSLENPNGEFCTAAKKSMEPTIKRKIELTCSFFLPKIADVLHFKFFSTHTSDFIRKTVPEVMDMRRKSGVKRHDLIDTLIEFDDAKEFETIDVLNAQAAVFFSAGHESTSTTLTLAMFEISLNRSVHDKLRVQLKKKLQETNGKVTYDLLMMTSDFPYLHQIVLETLRKYPAIAFLDRMCVNPEGYSLEPFGDFKIPPGMAVQIPMYKIFRDPNHFPEPEKFDPERFADWNNISQYVYFPFGTGPRNCVGERFALMAVKLLIAKILMNYRVEHLPTTPRKIDMLENTVVIQSRIPIQLNFIKDPLLE